MKIALAQQNYHIGDFEGNGGKIINAIRKAEKNKVDLIIFSEMSVCGYPPHDLLERKSFIEKCLNTIDKIAKECVNIAAIVGSPGFNNKLKGKKLFNSAIFLYEGKVKQIINKTLLPTYDIFDEYRYFEPNTIFDTILYKGKRIAVTLCEDLWDKNDADSSISKEGMYQTLPLNELTKLNPHMIINLSASPYSWNRLVPREIVLGEKAAKHNIPLLYVNQTGAYTDLIFDGSSLVIDNKGQVHNTLSSFEEDYLEINYKSLVKTEKDRPPVKYTAERNIVPGNHDQIAMIYKALVMGIKDYFNKSGFRKATLGLSGGIDSAVTLVIVADALGAENVEVLLMPSKYSSGHSVEDAVKLSDCLKTKYTILYIEDIVKSFDVVLSELFRDMPVDITEENLQARVRGTLLMAYSNKLTNIVINTSNKSEIAVGYSTMYGDATGSLSVLGDVYKTDIYRLAEYINSNTEVIPVNTMTKAPSAELRPGQKDSDTLPDYEILDKILYNYVELKKDISEIAGYFEKDLVERIINMVEKSEYKRYQFPPILRISAKAFGSGRRMPLVAKF